MPKGRRYTPEQIITKLREGEVLQSQGMSVEEAARTLEIAPQTYYRWLKEYGDINFLMNDILFQVNMLDVDNEVNKELYDHILSTFSLECFVSEITGQNRGLE